MDAHRKKLGVTFALSYYDYERLERMAKKIGQSVQFLVETFFEAMLRKYMDEPLRLSLEVPKLKFGNGKVIKIRLTNETHGGITSKAKSVHVSGGYLARVWCLDLIEQFEKQQRKKEVKEKSPTQGPENSGRRSFGKAAAALFAGLWRRK